MGKPAARVGDMHICPFVTPGTPPVPHVGGPITTPGAPTVLIGGMPAATLGSMCTCVGPPSSVIMGSVGVLLGGMPAARMGDPTAHGGMIAIGLPTVLIGEVGLGSVVLALMLLPKVVVLSILAGMPPAVGNGLAQGMAMAQAAISGAPFCAECAKAAAAAKS